ncbi:MAG: hypothetical protein K2M97_03730 [Muribaculaceae bacterium]|nr:hypothetical protein [Muribaculaceae bacterium]
MKTMRGIAAAGALALLPGCRATRHLTSEFSIVGVTAAEASLHGVEIAMADTVIRIDSVRWSRVTHTEGASHSEDVKEENIAAGSRHPWVWIAVGAVAVAAIGAAGRRQ